MICNNCSNEFKEVRKSAKYCSSKCRVYARRNSEYQADSNKTQLPKESQHDELPGDVKYTDKDVREMIAEALAGYTARIKILEDQLKNKVQTINVSGVAETVVNYEE